jgi:hypothetical protein
MPEYDSLKNKIIEREEIVNVYRKLSMKDSIPDGKQYWTLCNKQSKKKTSEINQLVSVGLINKVQFYGVDRDPLIIKSNQKNHNDANWFNGEWDSIIPEKLYIFNPEIIFFDSTNLAITNALIKTVKNTMFYSPKEVYFFINVMLNNPHHSNKVISDEEFVKRLISSFTKKEWGKWNIYNEHLLYSSTRKTLMSTYLVYRK